MMSDTNLTICKTCFDLKDPLDNGTYIIIRDQEYRTFKIVNEHMTQFKTYDRKMWSLDDVILNVDIR